MAVKKPATIESFIDYEGIVDDLEKKSKLTQGAMSAAAKLGSTVSTGMLGTDLMLGGGLLGGRWYTFFGAEGSAKSTGLAHMKLSAADSGVPIIWDVDYEGCVTSDTLLQVNGTDTPLNELIETVPNTIGLTGKALLVDSVNKKNANAELYYGGEQQVTEIRTSDGSVLKGFKHPVLVKTNAGTAEWKFIEDLKIGDVVYKRKL